ncbi:WxL protein host-binding domain-containing protein, partial [Enterococcus faecium]
APDTSFDGILLGGIQVKKDFSAEKEESNQPFFSEYAYVVGLMMSANDKEVVPDLKLNEVRSEVITNNAGVVAVLENPQPINIKGVTVEATV